MNYIAKADLCIQCSKDIKAGDVFDPEVCQIDPCMVENLLRVGLICKEVPDEVPDTLPSKPLPGCTLCDVKDAILALGDIIVNADPATKNFALEGVYVTQVDSPFCGLPVVMCEGRPSVLNPTTFEFEELTMGTQIGQNTAVKNLVSRQQVCEIAADGADAVLTNADMLALLAGVTFDNGLPADDAATVYLHSAEITLAHLGDETDTGFVSDACDAAVTDVDAAKTVNLEPGGSYELNGSQGTDIQPIEVTVVAGSVARVCFCVSVEVAKDGTAVPKA